MPSFDQLFSRAHLSPEAEKRIRLWLEGDFDAHTKEAIRTLLAQDPQKLEDAFFTDLSFGTGGMRGLMEIGTNRINIYTIQLATQGLAQYLHKQSQHDCSVFIGYDVRNNSKTFAEEAARVLVGNKIQVHIAKEICPTPLVSFACRHLHCSAAIMITASHNPPQYNGYKVYWNDGGQVVPPQDVGIVEAVHQVKKVLIGTLDSPLVHWVGDEIDNAYLKQLKQLQLQPQADRSLRIVYTNLHGTGLRLIPKALKQWGYQSVSLVAAQSSLDGTFPTASSPNPEEEKALALGKKQLLDTQSDILLATDPDADRVGIMIRHNGSAVRMTGNHIACLCLYYICTSLQNRRALPPNAGFIKTIVTTELFKKIAESFGSTCVEVLTGFKYITEKIRVWENSVDGLQYVFGAEESYGYLFGTFVRDKDAISSCCVIAEAASFAKSHNHTLLDQLHTLYRQYGIHRESLVQHSFSDTKSGVERITSLMTQLRANPPSHIYNIPVMKIEDFSKETLSLPKSNVLRFWLSDGSKLVIRPSGTEPKIKIYVETVRSVQEPLSEAIAACDAHLQELTDAFLRLF